MHTFCLRTDVESNNSFCLWTPSFDDSRSLDKHDPWRIDTDFEINKWFANVPPLLRVVALSVFASIVSISFSSNSILFKPVQKAGSSVVLPFVKNCVKRHYHFKIKRKRMFFNKLSLWRAFLYESACKIPLLHYFSACYRKSIIQIMNILYFSFKRL